MLAMIARRLLQLPLILAAVFVVTFVLAWYLPGNPLENPEGKRPPPEVIDAMQRKYNLDSPWSFARGYLAGLMQGDLGPSLHYRDQTVAELIRQGMGTSATLGVAGMIVAVVLGTVAGVAGAWKPGSVLDLSSLAAAVVGVSLPSFVTGSLLLVAFAGLVHWAPIGPWHWPDASIASLQFWPELMDRTLRPMVLPAITLGLAPAAYIARLIRLGLAETMSSDFVRTAYAKGLSRRRVLLKHGLKVAMLPVISFLGPAAAYVLTGSFVVEKLFAIPGMGEHFVNAVRNKDQFLILGVVLVFSSLLVVLNLCVDVAYAWIDPRIEVG